MQTSFGYCPECGARGISDSPKGVVCQRGHVYPRNSEPITAKFDRIDFDDIPKSAEFEDEVEFDDHALPNIDVPMREDIISKIANLME